MVLYPATKEECELWFTGLQKASLAVTAIFPPSTVFFFLVLLSVAMGFHCTLEVAERNVEKWYPRFIAIVFKFVEPRELLRAG